MTYDSYTDIHVTAKVIDRIFQRVFFCEEPDVAGELPDPDGLADDEFQFEDTYEQEIATTIAVFSPPARSCAA